MNAGRQLRSRARANGFASDLSQTFCDWNHSQMSGEFRSPGDRSATDSAALECAFGELAQSAGSGDRTSSAPACPMLAGPFVLIHDPRDAALVTPFELTGMARSSRAIRATDSVRLTYAHASDERSQV